MALHEIIYLPFATFYHTQIVKNFPPLYYCYFAKVNGSHGIKKWWMCPNVPQSTATMVHDECSKISVIPNYFWRTLQKKNRDTKFQSSNLKKQFHLKKVCVTVWKLTAEYIICTYAAKNSWHIVVSHTKTYEGWCYTECFHFPMSSRRSLSIRRNRIHGATGLSSWDGSTQFSKEMWHCIYHTSTFGTERAGIFTVIPLGIKALIHMAIFPQV